MRALTKQTYQNLVSDNIRFNRAEESKHQKINSIKIFKEDFKIRPEHKMGKSNYGSFKPAIVKS